MARPPACDRHLEHRVELDTGPVRVTVRPGDAMAASRGHLAFHPDRLAELR